MLALSCLVYLLAIVPIFGINIDQLASLFPELTEKLEENTTENAVSEIQETMSRVKGVIDEEMMMARSGDTLVPLPDAFGGFSSMCGPQNNPRTLNGDLCVILQDTCHITEEEFEIAKQTLVEAFERFGSDISVALITYKDDIQEVIEFQVISPSVLETVRGLQHKNGRGNRFKCEHCQALTYKALQRCVDILEQKGRDDRYFPNIVMSFTDGVTFKSKFSWEAERTKTIKLAEEIKSKRMVSIVTTFNNTAGSYTGEEEWNALHIPSTVPGVQEVGPIDINNPEAAFDLTGAIPLVGDDLMNDEVQNDLPSLPGLPGLPSTNELSPGSFLGQVIHQAFPGCPDPCTQFADVALIIDRSESIPVHEVDRVLNFFTFFINESTVNSETGLQFAVFTYNSEVYQHAFLARDTTKSALLSIMGNIPNATAKYTETGKAIEQATRHLINFNRKGARKTILVATDGRTWPKGTRFTNSRSAIAASKIAKVNDIDLFVLGLPNLKGANTGMTEWTKVASDPIGCTIVNMQIEGFDYSHLYLAGIALTNELCKKDNSASACIFEHTDTYSEEEEEMEPPP